MGTTSAIKPINLSEINVPDTKSDFDPNKKYSAEELGQKLFAVHVSFTLPENGVLEASYRGYPRKYPKPMQKILRDSRFTVHFCIGEMTRGFPRLGLQAAPFAIVSPLKELYPQLLNLNAYDTFVLGDFHLTKEVSVIVPDSFSLDKVPQGVQAYVYNPQTLSLRKAVEKVINLQKGWQVRMNSKDREERLDPALIGETNINTKSFYESIVKKLPHVAVGLRWDPLDGNAYLFGSMDDSAFDIAKQFSAKPKGTNKVKLETYDLKTEKLSLEYELNRIRAKFCNPSCVTEQNKKVIDRKIENIMKYIKLLNAEIETRKKHGKTLFGADKKLKEKALNSLDKKDGIKGFVKDKSKKLPKLPKNKDADITDKEVGLYMSSLKLSRAKEMYRLVDWKNKKEKVFCSYAFERLTKNIEKNGAEHGEVKELVGVFKKSLSKLKDKSKEKKQLLSKLKKKDVDKKVQKELKAVLKK